MRTPTPATHSQDARRALLRRTWQPPFDALEVDYSRPDLGIELTAADRTLLSGIWPFETTINGRPLSAAGPWEEVCWHSDQEVDYLELELPLSGGWKLQRQMALARKDQFLYLADAVMGEEALPESTKAEIRHTFQLPLAEGLTLDPAAETREVNLVQGRKRLASVLPAALPEWKVEACPGDLSCQDSNIVLHHAVAGRNLYSPLWLDLSPTRLRRDCTWRRLTIGQDLEVQPRDVAAGYRIQCGKEQWLVYRTLAPKASRTVLGQNYAVDFVLCRFLPTGKTEDILEIE
ncbi:MAG: hypothetical protein ACKVP0_12425 [Pirellulaceae bacterium]